VSERCEDGEAANAFAGRQGHAAAMITRWPPAASYWLPARKGRNNIVQSW
jgi:hypothetical protein